MQEMMLEKQADTLQNLAALDAAEMERAQLSDQNWKVIPSSLSAF